MNKRENTAFYLFDQFFLKKHGLGIFNYGFLTVVQNLAFLGCIIGLIARSDQAGSELTGLNTYLVSEHVLVLSAVTYFISYISGFYLQFWLANRFSINLNLNLNQVYNYAAIQSNSAIPVSTVIKDVTYEFARFGTNLILPVLDLFKHIVTLVSVVIFLAISFPNIIFPVLAMGVPYVLFWLLSKNYFQRTSVLISDCLADRQRFADKQYSDINLKTEHGKNNYVQESFERVINKIASYNVTSKTIASAPRVTLETVIIIGAFLLVLNDQQDQSMLFAIGLSALRVLPGLQGISAAISSIQLSWPAMDEYAQRRDALQKWNLASEVHAAEKFPAFIGECVIRSATKQIQFSISEPLDLSSPGLYLVKGESGIGKSTLVRILTGLEPILELPTEWKQGRSNVMFMDQHEQLLTGTVEENFIDFSRDDSRYVLEKSWGVFFDKTRFQTFEQFMKAKIGGNSGLSGGEMKRVKILKHLLSSEDVLVWDEPFDGIQNELVKKILGHIRATETHRRIFIIDHNIVDTNEVNYLIKLSRGGHSEVMVGLEYGTISN